MAAVFEREDLHRVVLRMSGLKGGASECQMYSRGLHLVESPVIAFRPGGQLRPGSRSQPAESVRAPKDNAGRAMGEMITIQCYGREREGTR